MFGLEMTGVTLFWLILGCLVGLLVELVLFKAACALADVSNPSWLLSFVVVLPLFVGRVLAWVFFESLKPRASGVNLYAMALVASGLVFWLICAAVYALALSVSLKKGLFTASAQILLDVLAGFLAVGITLIVLAVIQIRQGPANKAGWKLGPFNGAPIASRQ